MSNPGTIVAEGNEIIGDLQQIDPKFIKYSKELVPALFAPENLILKQINGQKVRAGDFLKYLQTYKMLLSEALSESESILMSTGGVTSVMLFNDCLNFYVNSMQESLKIVDFLNENELVEIHQKSQINCVAKV